MIATTVFCMSVLLALAFLARGIQLSRRLRVTRDTDGAPICPVRNLEGLLFAGFFMAFAIAVAMCTRPFAEVYIFGVETDETVTIQMSQIVVIGTRTMTIVRAHEFPQPVKIAGSKLFQPGEKVKLRIWRLRGEPVKALLLSR